MIFQNIITEQKQNVFYLTINRESKLNALNKATLAELHIALTDAFNDKTIGGVIITGAGTKAFIAGADITEFKDLDAEGGHAMAREWQTKVFDIIANARKPVIAAINGFALGGGLELAMACHIRIAAEEAKMGLPEVSLGLIPGYGGTQRLTQLIGRSKALEMIMTADMITGAEALQLGLVNHVVKRDDVLLKAGIIMDKILLQAPLAITAAIHTVNDAGKTGINGYETEITEFGKCFGTQDFKEGVAAFIQKRKAFFTGK